MDDKHGSSDSHFNADLIPNFPPSDSTMAVLDTDGVTEVMRYNKDPVFVTCPRCHRDIHTKVTIERHKRYCGHECCSCFIITCCRCCLAFLTGHFQNFPDWGWDETCKTEEGTVHKHECPVCNFLLASWTEK